MTAYLNPADYRTDQTGPQFQWLNERLAVHGYPTRRWSDTFWLRVRGFQTAQGWKGDDADGIPGPETLRRLAATPATLSLKLWKLTLPTGDDHDADEVYPIKGSYQPYFVVDSAQITCMVPADGATTSGSDYPRTELREMTSAGNRASWDTSKGTHVLEVSLAIFDVPGPVVVAQIHDADDDLVMVRCATDRTVYAEWSKGKGQGSEKVRIGKVPRGERFAVRLEAMDGEVVVHLNGKAVSKRTRPRSGCYYKTGAYLQHNDGKGRATVTLYGLEVGHR